MFTCWRQWMLALFRSIWKDILHGSHTQKLTCRVIVCTLQWYMRIFIFKIRTYKISYILSSVGDELIVCQGHWVHDYCNVLMLTWLLSAMRQILDEFFIHSTCQTIITRGHRTAQTPPGDDQHSCPQRISLIHINCWQIFKILSPTDLTVNF